jgi:uncharacterized membrane protein
MESRLRSALTGCVAVVLSLAAAASAPSGLADDSEGSATPDVRAVLFYKPSSSQSGELFAFYLPALYERYGTRIEVSGIDFSQPAGERAYRAAAERLNLPPRPGDQPIVVVADRAIVGLIAIAATLGDNFETLAESPNAAQWPAIAALEELRTGGVEDIKARVAARGSLSSGDPPAQSRTDELRLSDRIANGLAVLVLFGMVAALIHSLVRLRQQGGTTARFGPWALLIPLLLGLAISGYMAYTALAEVPLMCGPIGSCAEVQDSEYAKLFGIPMGVVGLVGYSIVLASWLTALYLSPAGGGWYWLPWAVALFGVLFSLRLTALEPFVIGAACLWCLGSAVSMTTVFWLLSAYTRKAEGSS